MILEQYIDPSGRWRTLWQTASGEATWFKTPTQPTTPDLQSLEAAWLSSNEYSNIPKVRMSIDEDAQTMNKIVNQIKANPTLTLAQLGTYLSTLPWYEENTVRFFIFAFGKRLAERNDVVIAGVTQNDFWIAVRNFIVNTPKKKLAKLILGDQNAIS